MALGVVIAGTVLLWRVLSVGERWGETVANTPGRVASALADAFKPKVSHRTVISSTLQSLKHDPKLVVLTATVNVEITKESEKTLWGMVHMGRTRARIKAYGNKVQYVVPTDSLSETNFVYDDLHKRIVVTIPPPRFDEEIVEVQSNPAMMEIETDVGWGRLDRFSGELLRDAARRDLRPAVVREGKNELLQEKARANARRAVQTILQPLTESLNPHVEVWVLFSDEKTLLWSQPLH